MEVPSDSEIVSLQKLKEEIRDLDLSPEYLEDKNLVRWLRARSQNLKDAEEMIRKNREWYVKNGIENLLNSNEKYEEWFLQFPWHISGFDETGCPVVVARLGKWDVQKAMASGKKSEFTHFGTQVVQLAWAVCQKQSESQEYMSQFIGIYDFKGLKLRQISSYDVIDAMRTVGQTFIANFPETLKRAYFINVSGVFQVLWKLIKPLVDDRTHSKIVFLGSDVEDWKSEISKSVPIHQFPARYGGTGSDQPGRVTFKDNWNISIV